MSPIGPQSGSRPGPRSEYTIRYLTLATQWAIVADCDAEVAEANETNNVFTEDGFECSPPLHPNLQCSFTIHGPHGERETLAAPATTSFGLRVDVADAPARNVLVRAGIVRGATIYEHTFNLIEAGGYRYVTFKYPLPAGLHTISMQKSTPKTPSRSLTKETTVLRRWSMLSEERGR